MTSLQLHPEQETVPKLYPEWGTGKDMGDKPNIWTPKPPTWQYSGEPIEQHYDLTDLKRSNVRLNDQLLPSPQHSVMHDHLIKLPYPAEHPYASHIERKAVFPKFDSPNDPERGVAARRDVPKHPEMPANAYDVIIVSKSKGSARRHERQALPTEGQKKALEWHEHSFDLEVKGPGIERKEYYPWPPKTLVPNLEQRDDGIVAIGDMSIGRPTANALRNVEKEQWTTTYDRTHTGLGPSNPNRLDDYDTKTDPLAANGQGLAPGTTRAFDPPRPFEGRINRKFTPGQQPDPEFPAPQRDPNYTPRLTRSEVEENRLWNGTEYISYPGPEKEDYPAYPTPRQPTQAQTYGEKQLPVSAEEQLEADLIARSLQHHDSIQQIEAANRWKELELQTPDHDLTALHHKMSMVNTKAQPKVYHDHENKYREERAGLYQTSYNPPRPQKTTAERFETSESHKDALNMDVELNGDMHEAIRYNRTLGGNGSVAQLHPQPTQYEAFEPFNIAKSLQKSKLQPINPTFKAQEGHLILKDSTYGDEFNTHKFLQDREMPSTARQEPNVLLSHANQLLDNARMVSLAAHPPSPPDMPLPIIPSSLVTGEAVDISRPRTAPEEGFSRQFSNRYSYQQLSATARYVAPGPMSSSSGGSIGHAISGSQSSRAVNSRSLDLSFKDDPRFSWHVGCGTPRPQTKLLQIQGSFTKSDAKAKFLNQFPEKNPDLRENLRRGKKHDFAGFNAQVLRGTPVLA